MSNYLTYPYRCPTCGKLLAMDIARTPVVVLPGKRQDVPMFPKWILDCQCRVVVCMDLGGRVWCEVMGG